DFGDFFSFFVRYVHFELLLQDYYSTNFRIMGNLLGWAGWRERKLSNFPFSFRFPRACSVFCDYFKIFEPSSIVTAKKNYSIYLSWGFWVQLLQRWLKLLEFLA